MVTGQPLIRTLGVVGGIAPESTIDYYRQILGRWRERYPAAPHPRVLINSIDLKLMLALVAAGDMTGLARYLGDELDRLVAAGAEIALFASNTPHLVFEELRRRSPIPLISIVESACERAKLLALSRVGLFGTRFTMQAPFYAEVFAKEGIAVVSPTADQQAVIHDIYMNQLVPGIFRPESRDRVLSIASDMQRRDAIDGLILGEWELPLLLRGSEVSRCPFLDTATIHVERAIAEIADVTRST